jgi:hypothetical protein
MTITVRHIQKRQWPNIPLGGLGTDEFDIVHVVEGDGISGLVSNPPAGCFKVLNIYVDQNGKLAATWEDTPQGG